MLTIAIPTYNRAMILGQTLEHTVSLAQGRLRDQVEILVSDNASSDGTMDILKSFETRYPGLVLSRRNCRNLGFSANVDAAICAARTKFVLVMSDDDLLEDGAIESLLKQLCEHPDVSMAFLASENWNNDLTARMDSFVSRPDVYFPDGRRYLMERRNFPPVLISGLVVASERWRAAKANRFVEVNSVHIIAGLKMQLLGGGVLFLNSRPYVRYRSPNVELEELCKFNSFETCYTYVRACEAMKGEVPRSLYTHLYMKALRTICGYAIREKVLTHDFRRRRVWALYRDHLDWSGVRAVISLVTCAVIWAPWWCFYIPFRWLVPKRA